MTSTPNGDELLPDNCPFCKSDNIKTRYSPQADCYRENCLFCGALGPNCRTQEQAITAWNTRTPAPSATVGGERDCSAAEIMEALCDFPVVWYNNDTEQDECKTDEAAEWFATHHAVIRAGLSTLATPPAAPSDADGIAVFKQVLWEHLEENLGRKLDAQETYIFHECVNFTESRRALTAPAKKEGE